MNKSIIIACCLLLGFSVLSHAGEAVKQGTLKLEIDDFKNDEGLALAILYNYSDEIADKKIHKVQSFQKASSKILERNAEVVFQNIPFGDYAVVVVHDENANGKPDHFIALPVEDFGFSNNYKRRFFFSGPPGIKDLAFPVNTDPTEMTIHIQ